MKKISAVLTLLVAMACNVFAFEQDDDFEWSDYEVLCFKYGVEPTWEQYQWLLENPTDFGYEDFEPNYMEVENE